MSQSNNKELEMAVGTSTMLESNMMEGENFYTPMETATEPESATQSQWTGVKNDTGQLCRVCANSSDYAVPIYEGEGLEHQLEFKIEKHLPIHVSITDALPLQLCYQCASTLIAYDSMLSNCLEAEKKLKAMQEAAEEASKTNEEYDDSQLDTAPAADDSDDEPLIQSKTKLLSEKSKATPIKKKILSKAKTRSVTVKTDKTATNSKEGEDKERSELLSTLDGMKQENDELDDDRQVLDSADLRDLFETNTEKLFRCNVCLKSYAKITSYEAHLRIHNNVDIGLICHVCGAQFDSIQELKIHVTTHNKSSQIFPCKLCGHVFPTLAARKRHKLNHLHAPEWTCEICSKKFKQHSFYIDHVLMHKLKKEIPKYVCSVCGLEGEDEDEMEEHKKTHEEKVILEESEVNENYTIVEIPADVGSEFICGECGKECPDIESVNAHMEEHVQLGRYQCSDCKLVFQYKYLLLQHARDNHAEQRPYTCDICSTSFTSKNGLRNHRTTHLPLRYPCDECGNVFKGRSGLYLHKQRVHRGRKDFACDYCGKQFALKCQKENHERVHTGEKPFKCETCGAGFKAQSGLYAHRKTHTDERPYKCEICGKHLRLPYNLRLHMRTHTGEKPYVCDICGRAFSQPGDCKKHKKTHRKNTEENVAAAAIDETMRDEDKPEYVDVTYLTYALNA